MPSLPSLEQKLKAVASARRLRILQFLKKTRGATVIGIAKALRMQHQATSKHLQILVHARLVTRRRRGLYAAYRISLPQAQPIRQVLALL